MYSRPRCTWVTFDPLLLCVFTLILHGMPKRRTKPATKRGYALQKDRTRKLVTITLSEEAREKLARISLPGHRSEVIDALIMAADEK
jgi:hypothetical protein